MMSTNYFWWHCMSNHETSTNTTIYCLFLTSPWRIHSHTGKSNSSVRFELIAIGWHSATDPFTNVSQICGCFFPRDLVTFHFINLYLTVVFQYLECTLHDTLVVATSHKGYKWLLYFTNTGKFLSGENVTTHTDNINKLAIYASWMSLYTSL